MCQSIRTHKLISVKVDLKPEHAETLKFIVNCRSHAWPPPNVKKTSEQRVVIDISSKILLPLSRKNEVVLENRYISTPKPDGLRCD